MKIKRNSKRISDQALAALLQVLNEGTIPQEKGTQVEPRALPLFDILPDAFLFSPRISRSRSISLLRNAFYQCRRHGCVDSEELTTRAIRVEQERRSVPRKRYTLWTRFRGIPGPRGFKLTWDGITLSVTSQLPPRLRRDKYFISGIGYVDPNELEGFGFLIARCDDRDEIAAVGRMLDAIQITYSLINIYFSWDRFTWLAMGKQRPEGKIWDGPNHFVFCEKEFLCENRIYYSPDYNELDWVRFAPKIEAVLELVPSVRRALDALQAHPFKEVLIQSLLLMQDGFSARNPSYRLLRYWSALDHLYGEPNVRDRTSQKLIERVLFAESDPIIARWQLGHAARLRNDYVHSGKDAEELWSISDAIRVQLARHLHYWIHHGGQFENHDAMLAFVDLPNDPKAFERVRTTVERRARFNERRGAR